MCREGAYGHLGCGHLVQSEQLRARAAGGCGVLSSGWIGSAMNGSSSGELDRTASVYLRVKVVERKQRGCVGDFAPQMNRGDAVSYVAIVGAWPQANDCNCQHIQNRVLLR